MTLKLEESKKKMKPHEIEIIKKWISQGAKYEKHWAFQTVKKPAEPEVSRKGWVKNYLDNFVLARLENARAGTDDLPWESR